MDLKVRKFLFLYKTLKVLFLERRTFFMLEFEVIENLKPNNDLIGILKDFKYKIKLGQIKIILHTNLKVIIPTEYQITYSTTLTIL
jgi:hypothetical protein